uniref:Outer dense fiber protein 3-like n=1 Tax=Echeneis naucrates TaxID=173247 RepID=A0A665UVI0_ECHNA
MGSAEPWVGTWRPHKPRGPIAALYGSPGPKYALPGLTGTANIAIHPFSPLAPLSALLLTLSAFVSFDKGINKHDPTKYKAPQFSLGKVHKQISSDCSPGPRYLVPSNITRVGHDGTPAFSLHSRPKEPRLFQAPGPGHYSPESAGKSVFRSAPAYSMSGRSKHMSTNQTIIHEIFLKNYYIKHPGLYFYFHRQTPGPAAYKVVDPCTYRQKPPQYSMTGRNFAPGETTKKPGPGAHYPENVTSTKAKAPSFSFGLRHSEYITPLFVNMTE